jgi:hypothetical protein
MKKALFSLMVVLMLSALVVPGVLAADPADDPAYSSIQVQNLGAADADIYIYYYNQDGTQDPASPVMDTVNVGESNTYFPVHAADGFNGSVVIESTEEIAVISNILYAGAPLVQSSWVGFEAGAPELLFPLIMKGNNSNYTTFNVQNTTGDPINILIEFVAEPGAGYGTITDVTDTIPAWSAHTYNQKTMTEFAGETKWVGSAKVTVQGAGAVAGVAQQLDENRKTGTAYNGFVAGAPEVDMPLIMKENNNMWTSINCQNLGPGATDITVTYTPEAGYPALAPETKTGVVESGTAVFIQYGAPKWVGAATVTNTAGNDLACIGNQTNLVSFYASAYEGFDATLASDVVVAPLIQYQNQGDGALWTSINIANLGGTATTATVDFKPAPGFSDIADMTVNIDPGALGVVFLYDPYGDATNAIGGAEVTSGNGMDLAVVINQQKLGYSGDVYSTYNGFAR